MTTTPLFTTAAATPPPFAGRHDFAVGFCAPGPNAFVQCEAVNALDDSGPLDSWASGVLYDNVRIDGNVHWDLVNPKQSASKFATFRRSQLFRQSRRIYPPGWEANSGWARHFGLFA